MDDEPKGEKSELKKEYIEQINKCMLMCNDIELLDFIFQLLQKRLNIYK